MLGCDTVVSTEARDEAELFYRHVIRTIIV